VQLPEGLLEGSACQQSAAGSCILRLASCVQHPAFSIHVHVHVHLWLRQRLGGDDPGGSRRGQRAEGRGRGGETGRHVDRQIDGQADR
jgi:hypothetical protein